MNQSIRARLRSEFFDLLRRAFETDDGRDMAVRALEGLLARRPDLPVTNAPLPYPDLGRPAAARRYDGTIFVTARFRTGSTLVWNLFRQVDACVSYYEPLNERRWFDPDARGDRTDATHRGVDDYWREYEGLADLGPFHRESWTDRRLYMGAADWDPGLRHYFDRLVSHAAPRRAVLQCNRIDFRLPWIRRQFPGAVILHLFRHPRDQWCSSLVRPADVPRDVTLAAFGPFDHFYLGRWARDLLRHFPCLEGLEDASAYQAFYLIWKLSYLFGVSFADRSFAFEALVRDPGVEIDRLMRGVGVEADSAALGRIVTDAPTGRWRSFADAEWFADHEAACEARLAEFFAAPGAATSAS